MDSLQALLPPAWFLVLLARSGLLLTAAGVAGCYVYSVLHRETESHQETGWRWGRRLNLVLLGVFTVLFAGCVIAHLLVGSGVR